MIKIGDIRKLVKVFGPTKQIRPLIRSILIDELRTAKNRFYELASGEAVVRREGALARSAAYTFEETLFTFHDDVGYLNARGATQAAAATLTGQVDMPLYPQFADQLAIPIPGVSAPEVIDAQGRNRHSVREVEKFYHLVFTDTAILGRRLHSKARDLVFLYAREKSVTVNRKIDLDKEINTMMNRIVNRIASIRT